VALSGIVYPQITAHMAQHEHHNAATHATALCSWLCTAADAAEGTMVDVAPVRYSTFLEQASPVTQLHFSHGSQPLRARLLSSSLPIPLFFFTVGSL
jgi:hypothetical protein